MPEKPEELMRLLRSVGKNDVASAEKYLLDQLRLLQGSGNLTLGEDKDLTGISLELRVRQIFHTIGLDIREGRRGKEDFVVSASGDDDLPDKLVLEVKSSRSPNPKIDDLRQLDDWVFDLSGEEVARKHGLGGGPDALAMATHGVMTRRMRHPTPHKGVLIFNGPLGEPFEQRMSPILHPSQVEFVEKRGFCVIGLDVLVRLSKEGGEVLWETLQSTIGEYR